MPILRRACDVTPWLPVVSCYINRFILHRLFLCDTFPKKRTASHTDCYLVLGEKSVPVPLGPTQIPCGLALDRTRLSAVTGRRLTAWDEAQPWAAIVRRICSAVCNTVDELTWVLDKADANRNDIRAERTEEKKAILQRTILITKHRKLRLTNRW